MIVKIYFPAANIQYLPKFFIQPVTQKPSRSGSFASDLSPQRTHTPSRNLG